jgi:hypothetical protein
MTINLKTTEKCVTRFGAALIAVATGFVFSVPANAQDDAIFEEIVVTAQNQLRSALLRVSRSKALASRTFTTCNKTCRA